MRTGHAPVGGGLLGRLQRKFEHGFEAAREGYRNLLAWRWGIRRAVRGVLHGLRAGVLRVDAVAGIGFFPTVDAGQITLHVRPPVGTRVEETAQLFGRIEERHPRRHSAPGNSMSMIDNIGLPLQRHQHDLQQHRH